MSKVDEVRALFERADAMECVENTYIPDRAGAVLRLHKVGRTRALGTLVQRDGKETAFHLGFPTRIRDVVTVSETEVTYKIGREDHTVTYRVIR